MPNMPQVSDMSAESLTIPSQQEIIQYLANMQVIYAIALLACGLVYLLRGWKIFKVLVVINALLLGVVAGNYLGGLVQGKNMPLFGAVAGGLLLAVLAWPLMKYAISLMGGLAGSVIGYGVWSYAAHSLSKPGLNDYAWAGALIGLIAVGLLAFVIFRLVVMIFTSLQGSMMAMGGLLSLLMRHQEFNKPIQDTLAQNVHVAPLIIAVPALIGFAFQYAASAKKATKKKKAVEGGD